MDRSVLVRAFGFPATLIHHDTLVLDRWLWLRRRLPRAQHGERLIDIGCGTGAFSIGAARRGYAVLGLSWSQNNQDIAAERAALCGAGSAAFEVVDVRRLDQRVDLRERFRVAICLETIEHILNDGKLIADIHATLAPGGCLYLTTPNFRYRAITPNDDGPFQTEELGWHVRRGYTEATLRELCDAAGFRVQRISYCSGFLSQKVTWVFRRLRIVHWTFAWLAILPLRILPPLFDGMIARLSGWPAYSICLEAEKQATPARQ